MSDRELLKIDLAGTAPILEGSTQSFLKSIQGNIIKGHGRDHACCLFLHFDAERVKHARRTLARLLPSIVTSAHEQLEQTRSWNEAKKNGAGPPENSAFGMFALSASGYQQLRIAHCGPAATTDLADVLFKNGLKKSNESGYLSWDPEIERWEPCYGEHDVHALILLADDDLDKLKFLSSKVKAELIGSAVILSEEYGRRQAYHDSSNAPNEHFGFRDGIAGPNDPLSLLADESPLLLAKERQLLRAEPAQGAFMTFLKMEQNVFQFKKAAQLAAEKARGRGSNMSAEDFEALVVGRRKGGVALVDAPVGSCPATTKAAEHLTRAQLNDFTYDGHDVDDVCPAHSHIRKMNRRLRADQKEFHIARRGMSYGPERRDLEAGSRQVAPSEGVGLLFLALHSKPDEAAALLIRASSGDKDALLGRSVNSSNSSDGGGGQGLSWPIADATTPGKFYYKMGDFVTLKGGEYLFVPSMHLINNFGNLVLGDS